MATQQTYNETISSQVPEDRDQGHWADRAALSETFRESIQNLSRDPERLARGLGWFSIALGVTELAAPRALTRVLGVPDRTALIRSLGVREVASGIGILSGKDTRSWLWSRVGGDMMDLAVLGSAARLPAAHKTNIAAATAAVAGVTLLDFWCSQQLTQRSRALTASGTVRVKKSILINRLPEDVYRFWRELKNLPQFMPHIQSVQVREYTRSHWVGNAPLGTTIEWDADIINDQPNELIAWRSLEGADVENSGTVRFERAPAGRGTIVTVEIEYRPPTGKLGATVAKLFGEEPEPQLYESLRRLKQIMEAGEIITTEGQPAGRAESRSWKYDTAVRRLAEAF